jgi:hypothetical protein
VLCGFVQNLQRLVAHVCVAALHGEAGMPSQCELTALRTFFLLAAVKGAALHVLVAALLLCMCMWWRHVLVAALLCMCMCWWQHFYACAGGSTFMHVLVACDGGSTSVLS